MAHLNILGPEVLEERIAPIIIPAIIPVNVSVQNGAITVTVPGPNGSSLAGVGISSYVSPNGQTVFVGAHIGPVSGTSDLFTIPPIPVRPGELPVVR